MINTWSPALLTPLQLNQIHATALDLAADVGLNVPHGGLLTRLAGQRGVRIAGQRVHFATDRIEAAVGALAFPPAPPDEFAIISGAYTVQAQDLDSGQVRQATYQDLVTLLRLGQQLGLHGSPPVRPLDVPEPLQEIAMYRACWENTTCRPDPLFDTTPMSSVQSAEVIYEMAQAISRPFAVGMYLISPFSCPVEGLDLVAAFADRGVPMWVGTMPIAGVNAPIDLLGAHVQALAELMAGLALLHAVVQPGTPIYWTPIDSVRAHPFDMRYASFVYGSAEDVQGSLLQSQINARYGIPLVAKSLLSTARDADQQAAAEKAAHTLLAALAGARIFTSAGLLGLDEYMSPAQVVIDYEIVQWVRRTVTGLSFGDVTQVADAIREVTLDGSSFLEHASTLRGYRRATWDPGLFLHVGRKAALAQELPSLWERARSQVSRHLAEADYVLPEADRRILDRIYQRAARGLD